MSYRTTGILNAGFFVLLLLVLAGCETPGCVKRDVQHLPQTICEGAKKTNNVLVRMDEWFRENLW